MKPLILPLFFLFFSPLIQASDCTEYYRRAGSFSLQRFEAADGTCFMSVDPFNPPPNFIYRSFLTTNEGLFMVFNSYGPEGQANSTGARVFYFFPRQRTPDSLVGDTESILKIPHPRIELSFSTTQWKITGMKGGTVKESSSVSPTNKGGVEFQNVQSLYLDSGFMLNQDPTGKPTRTSKFIDPEGRTCSVINREIFKYSPDGDPSFRFSDAQLKVFLAEKCPSLHVPY